MSNEPNLPPLPPPTVEYSNNLGEVTEAVIRGMVSNPVYVGVPPYERVVSDEVWIKSALQLIEEDGIEQFLVNMLYMLRVSLVDAIPLEAIPDDYDGPWPDEELTQPVEASAALPLSWHYPIEGLIYCSHDGLPMIVIDNEFVCVSEYLYAHLDGALVTDLLAEPVLTLVFQNGHTLPLLCPDCGQSLHVDDQSVLLDSLNGLMITNVDLTDGEEEEALIIEFGQRRDEEDEIEPEEFLLLHVNSVQGLTCPGIKTWHGEDEDLDDEEDFFDDF